eukprot:4775828-Pleurochrysis_carterae.AAC.2
MSTKGYWNIRVSTRLRTYPAKDAVTPFGHRQRWRRHGATASLRWRDRPGERGHAETVGTYAPCDTDAPNLPLQPGFAPGLVVKLDLENPRLV